MFNPDCGTGFEDINKQFLHDLEPLLNFDLHHHPSATSFFYSQTTQNYLLPSRQRFWFNDCCLYVTDGENDGSAQEAEVSASPVPLQRTKPAGSAPALPREPPPRQALLPKPLRQDRQLDSDAGKADDSRQRSDASSAANGETGVTVGRALSFQGRRLPPKGIANALFLKKKIQKLCLTCC